MSDDPQNPDPPPPDETDDAAELVNLAVDDGKGGKVVPLSSLIATKKEAKALNKRIKELEPVAQESASLRERLDAAQPYINALVADPRLRAEAIRITQGGQPDPRQPQDDIDALEYAEMEGRYLSDGVTPDVQWARKTINWHDARNQKRHEEQMRPMAGLVLGQKAQTNIAAAKSQTDQDGLPLATAESIDEVAALLPPHLLADERVVDLVLNNAIGLDRRHRRTPKVTEEPLYLDHPHGRRRPEPAIDADLKASLTKLGLTEKEFTEASAQVDAAATSRKGIKLGSW